MANKTLRLVPLGGLGEVGKNMMAVEYGENIMIVDSGIMFPENDMLGIDYIIPDFSYLEDKKDIVRGIVITHGHEDHVGAISHVAKEFNVPIYATRLTMGLIEVKLKRAGMEKGADDYLVKPFSARELLARVAARLEVGRLQKQMEHERQELAAAAARVDEAVPNRGPDLDEVGKPGWVLARGRRRGTRR